MIYSVLGSQYRMFSINKYSTHSLHWRHKECDGVSNHQPHDCLLNRLFSKPKKISKLRVTGLCVGKSPVTGEFPSQMASNAANVSILWRHHVFSITDVLLYKAFDGNMSNCIHIRSSNVSWIKSAGLRLSIKTTFPDIEIPTKDEMLVILRWRQNGRDGVSNHQLYDCLLNRLFRHRSKKTSKLRVTGLCVGNSPGTPGTGEFPAQMASSAEKYSIWWRHHADRLIFITRIPILVKRHVFSPLVAKKFHSRKIQWMPKWVNSLWHSDFQWQHTFG